MIAELLDRMRPRRFPTCAEDWVARVQSGKMSSQDQVALDAWLSASPKNADDYAVCNKLGHLASRMRDFPEIANAIPAYQELLSSKPARPSRRWNFVLAGGAAFGAVLLTVFFLPALTSIRGENEAGLVATRHGEQRRLPLADGTQVHVNTDSQLVIAFSPSERRVDFRKGEAFFEVRRDPDRPFVVHAENTEVRVVGTQFNVRRNGSRLEVVVTEGKVSVRPDVTRSESAFPEQVDLVPGEELLVDSGKHVAQVSSVDVKRLSAWRDGIIRFDDMPLESVIADINRYTQKPFEIADETIKDLRISGNFKIGDVDSVRFVLKNGFSIESAEKNHSIVLSREQRQR